MRSDRVGALQEKYAASLRDLETQVPMLEKLIAKPFEKEGNWLFYGHRWHLLKGKSRFNIQKKQLASSGASEQEVQQAPVVKMEEDEPKRRMGRRM